MERNVKIFLIICAIILLFIFVFWLIRIIRGNQGNQGNHGSGKMYFCKNGECTISPNGTMTKEECEKSCQNFDERWPNHVGEYYLASEKNHRTSEYRLFNNDIFIVRRGFDFVIMRNPENDGDLSDAQIVLEGGVSNLKMRVVNQQPNYIVLSSSVESPIGKGTIRITPKGGYPSVIPVYVIFNPFHEDDDVYMPDQKDTDEYVMNEVGYVFQGGSEDDCRIKAWQYNQFSEWVFYATMHLLERNEYIYDKDMSNPVDISRYLTWALNNDVLRGSWDPNLSDIVNDINDDDDDPYSASAPWEWNDSADIFQQFIIDDYNIVRFGQCWVFGAILNSALRTIGIPARENTNFGSAHNECDSELYGEDVRPSAPAISKDCSENITVYPGIMFGCPTTEQASKYEKTRKQFGCPNDNDQTMNGMVWNFHVWNDAWMKRPDIDGDYDGWQAVDATPQETSDGLTRCGPAPLKAIKKYTAPYCKIDEGKGGTCLNKEPALYDTTFVGSEVTYVYVPFGKQDKLSNKRFSTIVTSKPNVVKYDITGKSVVYKTYLGDDGGTYYKLDDEGNKIIEEDNRSDTMVNLGKEYQPDNHARALGATVQKVQGVKADTIAGSVNSDFNVTIKLYSNVAGTAKLSINGVRTSYTSKPVGGAFMKKDWTVSIPAGNSVQKVPVNAETIDISKANYLNFAVTVKFPDGESDQDEARTYITQPPLEATVVGCSSNCIMKKNESRNVKFTYTNLYNNKSLTNVKFMLNDNNDDPKKTIKKTIKVGTLKPGASWSKTFTINIDDYKNHFEVKQLIVDGTLTCNEIYGSSQGEATIKVLG